MLPIHCQGEAFPNKILIDFGGTNRTQEPYSFLWVMDEITEEDPAILVFSDCLVLTKVLQVENGVGKRC